MPEDIPEEAHPQPQIPPEPMTRKKKLSNLLSPILEDKFEDPEANDEQDLDSEKLAKIMKNNHKLDIKLLVQVATK